MSTTFFCYLYYVKHYYIFFRNKAKNLMKKLTLGNIIWQFHFQFLVCGSYMMYLVDTSEPRSKIFLRRHLLISRHSNSIANRKDRVWCLSVLYGLANCQHWSGIQCLTVDQLAKTQTQRTCAEMFLWGKKFKFDQVAPLKKLFPYQLCWRGTSPCHKTVQSKVHFHRVHHERPTNHKDNVQDPIRFPSSGKSLYFHTCK